MLDHDMPSFSSHVSEEFFFTPTGKLDENGIRYPRRESQKYEMFGENFQPMHVERSWSPRSTRSSMDGSSSGDSSSPRKSLFPRDEYALEALGGASGSEDEEVGPPNSTGLRTLTHSWPKAVRHDRNRWKKKCTDLSRRLQDTEKNHKQADDRVHELEYKLSEMQHELSTKKKESADVKGRNDDLMTQIDTVSVKTYELDPQ